MSDSKSSAYAPSKKGEGEVDESPGLPVYLFHLFRHFVVMSESKSSAWTPGLPALTAQTAAQTFISCFGTNKHASALARVRERLCAYSREASARERNTQS